MNASSSQDGHSAQVKMRMLLNGRSIAIAQMGPDFLLVKASVNKPPSNATIVLQVDQSERRWDVHLPEGISATSQRVAIAANL